MLWMTTAYPVGETIENFTSLFGWPVMFAVITSPGCRLEISECVNEVMMLPAPCTLKAQLWLAELPARSIAVTTTVFRPIGRGTGAGRS